MEALLIFIYKGEVNIEQKNLPALLKAAETLQIRGLSGGDIFAKESYKRLAELEQTVAEDAPLSKEETQTKKKQKVGKQQSNSILEKALTPRISQSENTNESAASDQSGKDDYMLPETVPNPAYHRLEMKVSSGCSVERLDSNDESGRSVAHVARTRRCVAFSPNAFFRSNRWRWRWRRSRSSPRWIRTRRRGWTRRNSRRGIKVSVRHDRIYSS